MRPLLRAAASIPPLALRGDYWAPLTLLPYLVNAFRHAGPGVKVINVESLLPLETLASILLPFADLLFFLSWGHVIRPKQLTERDTEFSPRLRERKRERECVCVGVGCGAVRPDSTPSEWGVKGGGGPKTRATCRSSTSYNHHLPKDK